MNAGIFRAAWEASRHWEEVDFERLFGNKRGTEVWQKYDFNDVLGSLCRECTDAEIEALLQFKRSK
jgi:hypothetical protein